MRIYFSNLLHSLWLDWGGRGGDIIYSVFQTYFIQNSFLRQSYWNIKCCCLFNLQFYLAYTSQIPYVLTRGENLVSCNTTTFWSVCIIKILMHKIKFWLHKYYWTNNAITRRKCRSLPNSKSCFSNFEAFVKVWKSRK